MDSLTGRDVRISIIEKLTEIEILHDYRRQLKEEGFFMVLDGVFTNVKFYSQRNKLIIATGVMK